MRTAKMSNIAEIRLQLKGMHRTASSLRARATVAKNRRGLAVVAGICQAMLTRLAAHPPRK